MNLKEIRDKARALTQNSCRVCPVCDGRACAGQVPGMGGTGTGVSFQNNVSALKALYLNSRLVHRVHFPKTEIDFFGFTLKMPLMIGPIGGISFNLNSAMPEEDYQKAVTFGADQAGIMAGTPDAVPIEVMKTGLAQAKALNGRAIPFIKPWEAELILVKLEMAKEAGCRAVCCDLDSIGLITLRLMGNPCYPKDQKELAAIIENAHKLGLSFIVKGIMQVSDALACAEAGADGLIVSNHGGRVLDSVPGTAQVLPAIAAKLKGRLKILADGGIRTGADILKMLALGADAVMIGRPFAIAAIGGGAEGVALYAETLRDQLEQAMIMTGCPETAAADSSLLWQG